MREPAVGDAWGLLCSLIVYRRPGRQRGLRRLYRPMVQPGDLVFDVGAHLGDRSVAFAALGCRVVALEPQPRVAVWLRRLVGRDQRITVRAEAVGRAVGTATLAVSQRHPTVATLATEWTRTIPAVNRSFRNVRWDVTVEVPVVTLDALIEAYGQPSFCKIDVEGHEAEVLAGLSRPVRGLSIEFVAGALDVAIDCVGRLEVLGRYQFNAVRGERRQFEFDDWVTGDRITEWIRAGADGIPSGDLYARISHQPATE